MALERDAVQLAERRRVEQLAHRAELPATVAMQEQRAVEVARGEHHDHMVDIDSGTVIEFHNDEIEALQRRIAAEHGYELTDHSLVLYVKKKH